MINIIDYQGVVCYTRVFDRESIKINIEPEMLATGIYLLQVIFGNDQMMTARILKY